MLGGGIQGFSSVFAGLRVDFQGHTFWAKLMRECLKYPATSEKSSSRMEWFSSFFIGHGLIYIVIKQRPTSMQGPEQTTVCAADQWPPPWTLASAQPTKGRRGGTTQLIFYDRFKTILLRVGGARWCRRERKTPAYGWPGGVYTVI